MAKAIVPDQVAVLYLRMSDERQERSIRDQRTALVEYAKRNGYKILREYSDPAISGDDTARRVGFLQMREDAAKREFSIVLCWDQDRFGRFDPIEGGHWILPFRNAGVRLETIAQGKLDWTDFAGRLIYLVQQEGKHAYLRDLSRNVTRGMIAKAKEGKGADGSLPFGYASIDGKRVIVEEQARIVRRIFSEYSKPGSGLRAIANGLNADGILSPAGKQWTSTTIRTILKNRKHTGAYIWGRHSGGRYFANSGGTVVSRSKDQAVESAAPIVHEGYCKAIVDGETFAKVQELLAKRRRETSPMRNAGGEFLLSGLLRCSHCGSTFTGGTKKRKDGEHRRYSCSGYHFRGRATCSKNEIEEAPLVECIVRMIERDYLGEAALNRLRKAIRKQRSTKQIATIDPKQIRKQIDDLDRQIDQGADRVLSAPATLVSTLYGKIDKLRQQRERLQAEYDQAISDKPGGADQDAARVAEAIAALRDMREAIRDADPADTKRLLSAMVSKVELQFTRREHGPKKQVRTTFHSGEISLRPDSKLSSLVTTAHLCNQAGTFLKIRFTARDLLRKAA